MELVLVLAGALVMALVRERKSHLKALVKVLVLESELVRTELELGKALVRVSDLEMAHSKAMGKE